MITQASSRARRRRFRVRVMLAESGRWVGNMVVLVLLLGGFGWLFGQVPIGVWLLASLWVATCVWWLTVVPVQRFGGWLRWRRSLSTASCSRYDLERLLDERLGYHRPSRYDIGVDLRARTKPDNHSGQPAYTATVLARLLTHGVHPDDLGTAVLAGLSEQELVAYFAGRTMMTHRMVSTMAALNQGPAIAVS